MPNIEFNQIVKQYGAVTVLENLNLTINEGEFLVLLGPSGCGKTTLLNMLAGLLEVTAGQIRIGERDVICVRRQLFDEAKCIGSMNHRGVSGTEQLGV